MAAKVVTGSSQICLITFRAQCSEQFRTSVIGKLFEVTTQGRGALVICNIGEGCPCGNYAKPLIERSKLAQKRLQGRLTQPSFQWTRRILEWLQAIQNQ